MNSSLGHEGLEYGRTSMNAGLLADLFGAALSLGMRVGWVRQGAAPLAPVAAYIQATLVRAAVPHSGGRRAAECQV